MKIHSCRATPVFKLLLLVALSLTLIATTKAATASEPSARCDPHQRKFVSEAVDREVIRVTGLMGDPKLARIFEACYPNTLDTTVDFDSNNGKPDTFIITGDIKAMWLRDSSAQVQAYLSLCKEDPHLAEMVAGLIHRQAACILTDPYANAFIKDLTVKSPRHQHDNTEMRPGVYERKWELDSLCYCIRLAYQDWKVTGDSTTFDTSWWKAMHLAVATMREQQRTDGPGPYHFIRGKKKPGDDGYGAPMKPTGMICSMFRNSDDQTTYLFNIPENLFAVTSLRQLAEMSEAMMPSDSLGREGRALADEAEKGIREYGTVTDSHGQKKYAYECDGLGNTLLMEDPGIPGLVSISYLDPTVINDPLVLASRRWALSPNDPFYSHGMFAEGTWSPHVGKGHIWPMGIIMRAMTSNDDAEITLCLAMLKTSSAGTGFMHESFDQDNPSKYTRHWFAWVNNLYGELILKLLRERPALLAKPVPSPSP